jgi:hypothetical protein
MLFVALILAPAVLGFVVRRWAVVALPLVGWPLHAIGMNKGWWGCCEPGDGWEFWTVVVTLAAVLVAGAGVDAGRRVAGRRDPS